MTTTGEGRGRLALAALTELARGTARPPTPAELDSGLDALRARGDGGNAPRRAPRSWLRLSLVGMLAVTSAVAAVSVVRSGRAPWPATAPALAYRIEGGSLIEGGYLRES